MAEHPLIHVTPEQIERARGRSRRKFQTDLQSDLATSWDNGYVEGYAEGYAEGLAESRTKAMVASIRNLIAGTGLSMEQSMSTLRVPDEEREKYRKLLNS